ncbi:MAG: hypothetical protein KC417_14070, partial [Myxococcales bacterium]|nr:hypothetical protein [Myxococcales bacterium]
IDDAYAGDHPVPVRRLVYRVTLHMPPGFGDAAGSLTRATAELYIDVSDERLRARFDGPGWPVSAANQVRIGSRTGAYVFDAMGGRPYAAGQLASWFFGGSVKARHLPPLGVVPPPDAERSGPGALVCALLAEWAGQPREALAHRCDRGGSPLRFRIGPWRGERTADVAEQLPRHELRADHLEPPIRTPSPRDALIVTHTTLARLRKTRADAEFGALDAKNATDARALLTINGTPVRWLDPGEGAVISGLPKGGYSIGAMRPFGNPVRPPRYVVVPGAFVID